MNSERGFLVPPRTEDGEHPARARQVDVVILGGGPAGTATALALAQCGHAVSVMERAYYESRVIGETLPPAISTPLRELGVWEQFLLQGHLESPGTAMAWGRDELYHNDYIFNPCGPGWHVDRTLFDALLAGAAQAAGAELLTGTQPVSCAGDSPSAWRVEGFGGRGRLVRRANFLVDATGRHASPARMLQGNRIVHDQLVGLVDLIPARLAAHCPDRRTLVEAIEAGWWYTSPLPDGRRIAALMTDGDLIPRGRRARISFWVEHLMRARHTRACVACAPFGAAPQVVSASSSHAAAPVGLNWLAVGDAAASFDPLSQQGVIWALESGLEASRAINARYQGDRLALERYARWVEHEFSTYLEDRDEYYGRERRWPESAFWRRRQGKARESRKGVAPQNVSLL